MQNKTQNPDTSTPNSTLKTKLSQEDIKQCTSTLEVLLQNAEILATLAESDRVALMRAAGLLSRPARKELKDRRKQMRKMERVIVVEKNRQARAHTGIRSARVDSIFTAPLQLAHETVNTKAQEMPELDSPRNCYVCKAEFTKLHFFYDAMCTSCGDLNYQKRFQTADLTGQVALITGSRLKIGYHATLMMLRSGARVIATTRFPVDSAKRFAQEADYDVWKDRLQVYGLDLRHTPSVEIFASYVERNYERLDILINNAAQTVRRPAGFYSHMMNDEMKPYHEQSERVRQLLAQHENLKNHLELAGSQFDKSAPLQLNQTGESAAQSLVTDTETLRGAVADVSGKVSWHEQVPGVGLRASAQLSQMHYSYDNSLVVEEVFPEGELDADLQQVDLRKTNSWRMKLGEVPTMELLEVQLVNSIAPFVLINRLIGLMRKENTGCKHIVNVSAMEGKFYRFKKEDRHPHTNMAKAALNMMTHTSASDFAKDGIYMNAVDTGWVTDEDPAEMSKEKQRVHDFQPPLDIVDGAARICDPFIDGINTGKHWCGKFLKDYMPIDW